SLLIDIECKDKVSACAFSAKEWLANRLIYKGFPLL
ncbi:MAG: hypothetical protein V7642_1843, partial [Burkholderiales bacterium]